jgi:hypothetical protein
MTIDAPVEDSGSWVNFFEELRMLVRVSPLRPDRISLIRYDAVR